MHRFNGNMEYEWGSYKPENDKLLTILMWLIPILAIAAFICRELGI